MEANKSPNYLHINNTIITYNRSKLIFLKDFTMQKLSLLFSSFFLILGLNSCGNSHDDLYTLFLVDEKGFSYSGVPYRCDSMRDWERTDFNGEFSFYPNESCTFDFLGLDGNYNDGSVFDDIVRIVDYKEYGKGGIEYDCFNFSSRTYYGDEFFTPYMDGSFEYDSDDQCRFYL